jgi:hypothetical protein
LLRLDDVWQAVSIQFGSYVTKHAAELPSKIIVHTGIEHLVLKANDTPCGDGFRLETLLVDGISRQITCLIEEQLVDKQIKD